MAQPARVEELVKSGEGHAEAGRLDEAIRSFEAARAEAERLADKNLIARTLLSVAGAHYQRGDMNDALTSLRRAYDLSVEVKDRRLTTEALSLIANVYADPKVGQFDQAISYYQQLLAVHRRDGNREEIADTLYNIAATLESKGDLDRALTIYREVLEAERQAGRHDEAAYVKRSIGIVLSRLNRASEAIPLFNEALKTLERPRRRSNGDGADVARHRVQQDRALRPSHR